MKSCWTLLHGLRLKFSLAAAFVVVLCIDVNAQDINFDDLRRGADRPLAQNVVIPGLGGHADRYMSQFSEVDRSRSEARAEARRQYAESASSRVGSSEESRKGSVSGSWTFIKKYEGGFAKFGLDRARTVYVVRCGNGREREIYVGNNGKWGTGGSGFSNNSASNFEDAAKEACE